MNELKLSRITSCLNRIVKILHNKTGKAIEKLRKFSGKQMVLPVPYYNACSDYHNGFGISVSNRICTIILTKNYI
jgi:hypothetical protein